MTQRTARPIANRDGAAAGGDEARSGADRDGRLRLSSHQIAEEAGVDLVLVGDTAAMTMLGHSTTTPVSLDDACPGQGCAARARDAHADRRPALRLLRALQRAGETATRYVKGRGAKSSSSSAAASRSNARGRSSAPESWSWAIGLTPQTATSLGGYKTQGRTADEAAKIAEDPRWRPPVASRSCSRACPRRSARCSPRLRVPVIGIGAGPAADGQVLVWHDLLGIYGGHQAKFAERYADLREEMVRGVGAYAREVRERRFPAAEHTYAIDDEELRAFRRHLNQESLAAKFGGDWSATEI